jgi:hypothetical protein
MIRRKIYGDSPGMTHIWTRSYADWPSHHHGSLLDIGVCISRENKGGCTLKPEVERQMVRQIWPRLDKLAPKAHAVMQEMNKQTFQISDPEELPSEDEAQKFIGDGRQTESIWKRVITDAVDDWIEAHMTEAFDGRLSMALETIEPVRSPSRIAPIGQAPWPTPERGLPRDIDLRRVAHGVEVIDKLAPAEEEAVIFTARGDNELMDWVMARGPDTATYWTIDRNGRYLASFSKAELLAREGEMRKGSLWTTWVR